MPPHQDAPAWLALSIIPLFFTLYIIGWVVVCGKIAQDGWSDFAREYRVRKIPRGKRFAFLSGRFSHQGTYHNVLNITISQQGMGMSVVFLFRSFHPPLCVPWSGVTVTEIESLFGKRLLVQLRGSKKLFRFSLPMRAKRILEQYCPVQEVQEILQARKTLLLLVFLLWLLFSTGLAFLFESLSMSTDRSIQQHVETAKGTVTEVYPGRPRIVEYNFDVNGKVYQGRGESGDPNPDASQLKTGDTVTVFYDGKNPEKSIIMNIDLELMNDEADAVLVSLVLSYILFANVISWVPLSWYKRTERFLFG